MSGPIIDPFCASEENTKPECLTWRTKCLYAHLPRPGADEFFSPDSGAFVPPASSRLQYLEALGPIEYLPTYSILGPALSPASHTCTSPAFSQGNGDLLSIRNLPPAGSLISGVRGLCERAYLASTPVLLPPCPFHLFIYVYRRYDINDLKHTCGQRLPYILTIKQAPLAV